MLETESTFKAIETQEELDNIVKERLKREREANNKRYEGWISPSDHQKALEEANQKLKSLEFKVGENDRKISGMQKIIDNEIKERKIAENSICFVTDCKLRRPPLGTYKKETA